MIARWMLYGMGMSALVALVALALEHALRLCRRSTRWVWLLAIVASAIVPLAASLLPGASPSQVAGTGDPLLPIQPGGTTGPAARSSDKAPATLDAVPPGGTQTASGPAGGLVGSATPKAGLAKGGKVDGSRSGTSWSLSALDSPLLLGWLVAIGVFAALFGRTVIALKRSRRHWREGTVDGDSVLVSKDIGPAVVGVARMQVVVPEWALGMEESLRALMLHHEREHVRAGDPRLLFAGALIAALFPWNLVLWWQLRRLRAAVEIDCDARVLAAGRSIETYGTLLLMVGAHHATRGPLTRAAFAEPASMLARRIDAMSRALPLRRAPYIIGLAAFALAASVSAAAIRPPALRGTYARYVSLLASKGSAIRGDVPPVRDSGATRLVNGNEGEAVRKTVVESPAPKKLALPMQRAELIAQKNAPATQDSSVSTAGADSSMAAVHAAIASLSERLSHDLTSKGDQVVQGPLTTGTSAVDKADADTTQTRGGPSAAEQLAPPSKERTLVARSRTFPAGRDERTYETLAKYFPEVLTGAISDSVFMFVYGVDGSLKIAKSIGAAIPGQAAKVSWSDLIEPTDVSNIGSDGRARKASAAGSGRGLFKEIVGFEAKAHPAGVYGPHAITVVSVVAR